MSLKKYESQGAVLTLIACVVLHEELFASITKKKKNPPHKTKRKQNKTPALSIANQFLV